MKNIFLMQYNNYLNGHILVSKSGNIEYNKNEFDILNFIFCNKIDSFQPIIIEYELNELGELSCKDQLINIVKELILKYKLNPFLNINNINDIVDVPGFHDEDYFIKHNKEYENLKIALINKNNYLLDFDNNINYNSTNKSMDFTEIVTESLKDGTLSEDEIFKIKNLVLDSFNINKAEDTEWAKQQIDKAWKNGFIKSHHDSNEIITMGTLMTILNRLKDNL